MRYPACLCLLFLLCAGNTATAQNPLIADMQPGMVVIASTTGETTLSTPASPAVPAQGFFYPQSAPTTLSTGKDASCVLLFSNGLALYLDAQTTLTLTGFEQKPFEAAAKNARSEPSPSRTTLTLEQGRLYASHRDRRPISSLFIQTPHAEWRSHSEQFGLIVEAASTRAVVFQGHLACHSPEADVPVFVQRDQEATATLAPAAVQLSPIPLDILPLFRNFLERTEAIRSRLFFLTHGAEGHWGIEPLRVLPKSTLLKAPAERHRLLKR